jgi:hypothetical protein
MSVVCLRGCGIVVRIRRRNARECAEPGWGLRRQAAAWRKRARRQAVFGKAPGGGTGGFGGLGGIRTRQRLMVGSLLADVGEWDRLGDYIDRLSPVMTGGSARYAWGGLAASLAAPAGEDLAGMRPCTASCLRTC